MESIRRVLVAAPTLEPVTLAEARTQLRIDGSDSDTEVTAMISAARDMVEQYTNRYWSLATVAIYFDKVPPGNSSLYLPIADLQSVDSVTYLDGSKTEQTVTGFTVDLGRQLLSLASGWPQGSMLKVTVTAGPDLSASPAEYIPPAVKGAILMVLSDLYEHRTSQMTVTINENPAVSLMLYPYRREMGV